MDGGGGSGGGSGGGGGRNGLGCGDGLSLTSSKIISAESESGAAESAAPDRAVSHASQRSALTEFVKVQSEQFQPELPLTAVAAAGGGGGGGGGRCAGGAGID